MANSEINNKRSNRSLQRGSEQDTGHTREHQKGGNVEKHKSEETVKEEEMMKEGI